eukprot:Amastigsp_a844223_12.p2 type:complete len:230 gc:universal Amastigsp_a844223_12:407-1096(+)
MDGGHLWHGRAAQGACAWACVDGCPRLVLPHRAVVRLRCGRAAHHGRGGRRRLCSERREGVHLRRRGDRRVPRDGAHRRGRRQRHLVLHRRRQVEGALVRNQTAQDGMELSADAPRDYARRARAPQPHARRAGQRVHDRHERARRRTYQHRRVLARRSRRGSRVRARLHAGPLCVRQADCAVPEHPVCARRPSNAAHRRPADDSPRRVAARRGVAGRHGPVRDGKARGD